MDCSSNQIILESITFTHELITSMLYPRWSVVSTGSAIAVAYALLWLLTYKPGQIESKFFACVHLRLGPMSASRAEHIWPWQPPIETSTKQEYDGSVLVTRVCFFLLRLGDQLIGPSKFAGNILLTHLWPAILGRFIGHCELAGRDSCQRCLVGTLHLEGHSIGFIWI